MITTRARRVSSNKSKYAPRSFQVFIFTCAGSVSDRGDDPVNRLIATTKEKIRPLSPLSGRAQSDNKCIKIVIRNRFAPPTLQTVCFVPSSLLSLVAGEARGKQNEPRQSSLRPEFSPLFTTSIRMYASLSVPCSLRLVSSNSFALDCSISQSTPFHSRELYKNIFRAAWLIGGLIHAGEFHSSKTPVTLSPPFPAILLSIFPYNATGMHRRASRVSPVLAAKIPRRARYPGQTNV